MHTLKGELTKRQTDEQTFYIDAPLLMPVKMPLPPHSTFSHTGRLCVCGGRATVGFHLAGPWLWVSCYEAAGASGDLHRASGGVKRHSDHRGARLVVMAVAFSPDFSCDHYWPSGMSS